MKLFTTPDNRIGIRSRAALHINFKTSRSTQAPDGRRIKCYRYAIRLLHADTGQFVDNIVRCGRTFRPVFECHEHGCRAGLVSSANQIKTIDYKLVGNRRIFRNRGADRFSGSGGSGQCCAIGQNCCSHHVALIFRRHKTSGNCFDQIDRNADDAGEYECADNLMANGQC